MSPSAAFILYTYYRSSCAGRLRIALNFKNVPYESICVKLGQDAQNSVEYLRLNPSGTVPVLVDARPESKGIEFPIPQSPAALEYLEETLPDATRLLPPLSQPIQRAQVRALVNIIVSDIQPTTSRRLMRAMDALGKSGSRWSYEQHTRGLLAYEKVVEGTAGKYSVGSEITLADVCLIPALWNALHYGVDVQEQMPITWRIYELLSEHEAVKKAHWTVQPDSPPNGAWD